MLSAEVHDAMNKEAHGAMDKEHHVCARRRVGEPAVSWVSAQCHSNLRTSFARWALPSRCRRVNHSTHPRVRHHITGFFNLLSTTKTVGAPIRTEHRRRLLQGNLDRDRRENGCA